MNKILVRKIIFIVIGVAIIIVGTTFLGDHVRFGDSPSQSLTGKPASVISFDNSRDFPSKGSQDESRILLSPEGRGLITSYHGHEGDDSGSGDFKGENVVGDPIVVTSDSRWRHVDVMDYKYDVVESFNPNEGNLDIVIMWTGIDDKYPELVNLRGKELADSVSSGIKKGNLIVVSEGGNLGDLAIGKVHAWILQTWKRVIGNEQWGKYGEKLIPAYKNEEIYFSMAIGTVEELNAGEQIKRVLFPTTHDGFLLRYNLAQVGPTSSWDRVANLESSLIHENVHAKQSIAGNKAFAPSETDVWSFSNKNTENILDAILINREKIAYASEIKSYQYKSVSPEFKLALDLRCFTINCLTKNVELPEADTWLNIDPPDTPNKFMCDLYKYFLLDPCKKKTESTGGITPIGSETNSCSVSDITLLASENIQAQQTYNLAQNQYQSELSQYHSDLSQYHVSPAYQEWYALWLQYYEALGNPPGTSPIAWANQQAGPPPSGAPQQPSPPAPPVMHDLTDCALDIVSAEFGGAPNASWTQCQVALYDYAVFVFMNIAVNPGIITPFSHESCASYEPDTNIAIAPWSSCWALQSGTTFFNWISANPGGNPCPYMISVETPPMPNVFNNHPASQTIWQNVGQIFSGAWNWLHNLCISGPMCP